MKTLMTFVVGFVLLGTTAAIAGPGGCGGCGQSGSSTATGPRMLGDLALTDADGDTVVLATLAGDRPAVFACLKTDAGSDSAARLLQDLWEGAGEEPVYGLWGIVCGSADDARALAKRAGLDYPLLLDPGCGVMPALGVAACPGLAFVGQDGKVVVTSATISKEMMDKGIAVASGPTEFADPVCGMKVTKEGAAASHEYQGRTYYFCNTGCRDAFAKEPGKYLSR